MVAGAKLDKSDWKFSGRRETSRRTITASVLPSGYDKMVRNWIYIDPLLQSPSVQASLEAALEAEGEEERGKGKGRGKPGRDRAVRCCR